MKVQVIEDDMMDKFKVGDLVQFVSGEEEMYSYEVPKTGTFGIIEVQSFSNGLEQMLGVIVPMSIVKWEDGSKVAIFSHDIAKANLSPELTDIMKNKINSIQ